MCTCMWCVPLQLLPLLEVIGSANKVLARVGRFMAKYGEMDMFPVQVQVRGRAGPPCHG